MNLLPKDKSEFSNPEYWNSFFKQRLKKSFEWYGEYPELCGLLHKYMKVKDDVLVVGCGNSKLSADLYDVGFRKICNIDISKVVIKQMKAANASRPQLKYEIMDALNMTYSDGSYSVVLDKGTLDALMPDSDEDTLNKATQYLDEVSRVLRLCGRYICVTLLERHILSFVLDYLLRLGWMVRLCRCVDAEQKTLSEGGSSTLPVFMLVCTKLKKLPNSETVLEMSLAGGGEVSRCTREHVETAVRSAQQVALVCGGLARNHIPGREVNFDIAPHNSNVNKYTAIVVDRDSTNKPTKYAALIVPPGREKEFICGTKEGRKQVLESTQFDRITFIFISSSVEKTPSQKEILEDVTPLINSVAPEHAKGPFPIVSASGEEVEEGNRTEVVRGESEFSGQYVVEDVDKDGTTLRRLYFTGTPHITQSEAFLKKIKGRRSKKTVVDVGRLSCEHHLMMSVGAATSLTHDSQGRILLIGVGGGALCGYLHQVFPQCEVTGVELDPAMISLATNHFSLATHPNINIVIDEGVNFITTAAAAGEKYDVVMFDVDSKDTSVGMSCPPVSFTLTSTLKAVRSLLTPSGVFVLNLVCRSDLMEGQVLGRLMEVFMDGGSQRVGVPGGELGQVIVSWPSAPSRALPVAAHALLSTLRALSVPADQLSRHIASDLYHPPHAAFLIHPF